MPFDLSSVRIGHPGAHDKMAKRVVDKRAACALYTAPAAGESIDGLKDTFTMTWAPSCVTSDVPSQIDIYLTAPNSSATKAIHVWQKVNFAAGNYTDVLRPKWWNSTASVSLQLSFVASGTPLFLSDLPVGPSWTALYDSTKAGAAAATDTAIPDNPYQTVNNNFDGGGLSKGALAAAVIFPILAVAAALVIYVKFSRKKEAKKRQRWSQAMDKRMSVASKDWVSGGRPSGVGNRNTRASSWYVTHMGQQRPSSTFANEGGQAGIGARYGEPNVHPSSYGSSPEMGQVRPRALSSLTPSDRISRVSFAGDSRPSIGDSLRPAHSHGTPTRAFHNATTAPDEMEMSPTQTTGPFSLSADEIRAKVAQGQEQGRPSVDGDLRNDILQMPAATHLRSGQDGSDDFIVRPDSMALAYGGVEEIEPPAAAHSVTSPTGAMPMLAPNSSPDDMMRAYAQARNAGPSSAGPQGMRTLYAPSNADGLTPASAVGAEDKNPYRKSVNSEVSEYSDVGKAS